MIAHRDSTMQYTLICLLHDGAPLSTDALADQPRYTGNLLVDIWEQGGAFRRPVRQARLMDPGSGPPRDLLPPLFEPVLVKMTDARMTLEGIEIKVVDGNPRYYRQSWLLRGAASEPPAPLAAHAISNDSERT